ncbi:efflux RND transporter periplasmic adaptor subunit [Hylemonella gracilis]|uniref:Efflux RND transporter periplasmic adaptor subunit n=1 Tax=Hylemonella gracilis TaxID=80880 RepID=A0A4P6UP83_9BURK|nr:efflux RND transporter periplasmic adaptor subunit [Hylemonella gracilis]QBK06626.1 efflux RND transporter periplasmic adaptor subunit [Hylemonella gracilis]
MASRLLYPAIAALGIGVASVTAWWFQHRQTAATSATMATAPATGPASARPASAGGGLPSVEAAAVVLARVQDDAQAVGTLRSRQSVMLRPEVAGRIAEIAFRDGARVKRGQLLARLDDELPRAELSQAEAQLSIARANLRRNEELVAQSFVARSVLDESRASLQVAEAQAALARARLARMRITAPFDGMVGITKVDLGEYVRDGADIVNLEDIEALYVDFRLPERLQAKVRPGQRAYVSVDALPGQSMPAVIQAIDPLVDADGRSLAVRGCIDNRKLLLRPGMFARVTTVFGARDNALVVPEEAIVPQGSKQYVFRLEAPSPGGGAGGQDGDPALRAVRRVEVTTGLRQPGRVEVVQGLAAGDVVITAGQQRMRNDGAQVRVAQIASGLAAAANAQALGGMSTPPRSVGATPVEPGNPCS